MTGVICVQGKIGRGSKVGYMFVGGVEIRWGVRIRISGMGWYGRMVGVVGLSVKEAEGEEGGLEV